MEDILQTIVAHKRREVALHIAHTPLETMRARAEAVDRPTVSMSRALKASSTGIIAEFKRRSPSKGWIARYAHPSDVAAAYERSGAAAMSILTDGEFFGGIWYAPEGTPIPPIAKPDKIGHVHWPNFVKAAREMVVRREGVEKGFWFEQVEV